MKYIAIFAAIFVAFLLGLCFLGDDSFGEQIPSPEVPPIVDDEILGDDKPVISPDDDEESNIPTIEEYVTTDEELYIYELIYSDLSTQYETHTAYINLSNNEEKHDEDNVYGLMYVDYENAYKTMDKDFMESVIWAFKELYKIRSPQQRAYRCRSEEIKKM